MQKTNNMIYRKTLIIIMIIFSFFIFIVPINASSCSTIPDMPIPEYDKTKYPYFFKTTVNNLSDNCNNGWLQQRYYVSSKPLYLFRTGNSYDIYNQDVAEGIAFVFTYDAVTKTITPSNTPFHNTDRVGSVLTEGFSNLEFNYDLKSTSGEILFLAPLQPMEPDVTLEGEANNLIQIILMIVGLTICLVVLVIFLRRLGKVFREFSTF